MKLRKTIKRIVALSTGATMLGATVLGAMAADLSEYPSPMFIKNGLFDGLMVIGADGDTQDMLGAMDIISSLQAVAVGGFIGTSAVTSSVGDVYKFEKASDKLNMGENMTSIRTKLYDTQLPIVLADGTLTTAKGAKYDYEQKITIPSTSSALQHFADKDYEDEKPVIGIKMARNSVVLTYTLDFTKDAKSTVDSDDNLIEFEDRAIEFLGEVYDIVGSDASTRELSLMRGALKPTLEEGETATYTIDGKEYEVTVLIITDVGTNKVKFKVNGEVTDSMVKGDVYQLSDGVNIGAREILPNEAGDVTQDMVEFYIGAKKITITGGANSDSFDNELSIDDEDISNIDVSVKTTVVGNTSAKAEWDNIKIRWTADDDLFITEDGNEVVMPGLESIKFYMDGFYKGAEEEISLYGSSDDTITLSAPVKDYDVKLDLLYDSDEDGEWDLVGGGSAKKIITKTCTAAFQVNMSSDDYFVVTKRSGKDGETAVLQLSKVHTTDGVTVKDYTGTVIAENKKVNSTFDAADMEITVVAFNKTLTTANFTVGTGCVDPLLITAEGLQITLPEDTMLYQNATDNLSSANIDCSESSFGNSINVNLTSYFNGTSIVNGSKICYATNFDFKFFEEDKDENIGDGGSGNVAYFLTANFNTANEAQALIASGNKSLLSNTKVYSIEDTRRKVGYIVSDVSSKIIEDKVSDQSSIEITYPGVETYGGLYIGSKASAVTTTAGTESVAVTKIEVGAAVLDTSLSSYTNQNLIVIGGPAINRATAALTGKSYPAYGADSGIPENAALLKLIEQADGTVAVIVAGWEADDTQRASRVLAESENYALSGTEIVVTGTSLTDISVGVPAAE